MNQSILLSLFLRGAGLHARVSAREFFDAPGGIDELLLAGKERMARRADADLDVAPRRARMVRGAASAVDRRFDVIGMNICFHDRKRELDSSGLDPNSNQKERHLS
jgi:hypothetical protein